MTEPLTVICGDALTELRELSAESVQCCVTSPPYWGLRDYGTGAWEGGDAGCDHRFRDGERDPTSTLVGTSNKEGFALNHYRNDCGRCGAKRIDSQLGLEKTPEEYVCKMVEIFREVRRILRNDGTCWLNLGDSYAGSMKGEGGTYELSAKQNSNRGSHYGKDNGEKNTFEHGLKPKDLCGIPWRVAFALQQPYYTGKIKRVEDRIWLAAMIDGEGCMWIHKRKAGQNNGQGYKRQNDSYGAGLEVANTHRAIVERCLAITGFGSISTVERETKFKKRNIPLHRWNLRSNQCRDVIREVYPHLVGKQHEARILLGCPSSGPKAEAAHRALILLHNAGSTDVDFPAPASMFEEGWYLRSDVIWSKKNPMPESVTDRPTKSHEYLFLLTKSASYFYDAEAIKENGLEPERIRGDAIGTIQRNLAGRPVDRIAEACVSRNKRSVWTVATHSYPEAHFATYPPDLIKPCILAGTSAKGCCARCGAQWERIVERESFCDVPRGNNPSSFRSFNDPQQAGVGCTTKTLGWQPTCKHFDSSMGGGGTSFRGHSGHMKADGTPIVTPKTTTGWDQTCDCESEVIPCTVLDPFAGSGTTGAVALEIGRRAILIELNPKYVELIERRCNVTLGLALA